MRGVNRMGSTEVNIDNFKAVIFDCDDTVLETARLRWSVLQAAACRFSDETGRQLRIEEEAIRASWGKPFNDLIADLAPGVLYDHFVKVYRDEMLKMRPNPTRGAKKLLKHLENEKLPLQIVSSGSRFLIEQDLDKVDLRKYFQKIYGYEDCEYHKPDPRVLDAPLRWLRDRDIEPCDTVFIGDSIRDYRAIEGHNINFIGVLTGLETYEEMLRGGVSPEFIVEDLTFLASKKASIQGTANHHHRS
jgi:phosphoglycolate phosphatase-like HAD superfamily hydrolase